MTQQDFKALLDVLTRIAEAIEGKQDKVAVEIVNRFAVVFRQLKILHKTLVEVNEKKTAEAVLTIMKTYTDIAVEVMNENSQSSK
jgi:hypothetical protein